jgi:small subunit ribosomal protein S1
MSNEQTPGNNPSANEAHSAPRGAGINVGDRVTGRIVKITGQVAFIDFGKPTQGYVELSELKDEHGELTAREGDTVDVEVIGTKGAIRLSARRAKAAAQLDVLKGAFEAKRPVMGRVVGLNKGGFEIDLEGVRAFCPASQIAERFVKDQSKYIGQSFEVLVTDLGDGKRPVVSRRAVLESEKAEARGKLAATLQPGTVLQGKVTRIADFGAFVDIGDGVEGLVHVSEISHERIKTPREVVKEGDAVEVKVLKYDAEQDRISLSMKALQEDPWTQYARELVSGQRLTGKVVRLQPFGAFVELAPGVDGLMHVSAISAEQRIEKPEEVLQVGQEIEVVVDRVDLDKQRIALISAEVADKRNIVPAFKVEVGQVVTGKVVKVERYGVFIELGPRTTGLCPNGEMDTPRNSDHGKMFPIGTELEVKVVEVDKKRNRIRLSRKALKDDEEAASMREYRAKEKVPEKLGTFGDLLKDFLAKK